MCIAIVVWTRIKSLNHLCLREGLAVIWRTRPSPNCGRKYSGNGEHSTAAPPATALARPAPNDRHALLGKTTSWESILKVDKLQKRFRHTLCNKQLYRYKGIKLTLSLIDFTSVSHLISIADLINLQSNAADNIYDFYRFPLQFAQPGYLLYSF